MPVIGDAVHYYRPRAAGLWGTEPRKPQPATITDVLPPEQAKCRVSSVEVFTA